MGWLNDEWGDEKKKKDKERSVAEQLADVYKKKEEQEKREELKAPGPQPQQKRSQSQMVADWRKAHPERMRELRKRYRDKKKKEREAIKEKPAVEVKKVDVPNGEIKEAKGDK